MNSRWAFLRWNALFGVQIVKKYELCGFGKYIFGGKIKMNQRLHLMTEKTIIRISQWVSQLLLKV